MFFNIKILFKDQKASKVQSNYNLGQLNMYKVICAVKIINVKKAVKFLEGNF